MEYQIPRQGSIGSQFEWHWDVYLDDADGFYFWFYEKYVYKKKNHSEKILLCFVLSKRYKTSPDPPTHLPSV